MCNQLHEDSITIPNKGIGYKLFNKNIKGKLTQWFGWAPYNTDEKDKVIWDDFDEGFCFFWNKEEADAHMKEYNLYENSHHIIVLRKIHYSYGMGRHIEELFSELNPEIGLCKEFVVELEDGEYLNTKEKYNGVSF